MNPIGIEFFDNINIHELLLITDPKHLLEGWVCRRAENGNWLTLRKATKEDYERALLKEDNHELVSNRPGN